MRTFHYFLAFFIVLSLSGVAHAELVSVGQFGFHPDGNKQVVSYSNAASGTFQVRTTTGAVVFSGSLVKARDANNNIVQCQGNNPCLVGVFSSFKTPGTYYVTTSLGGSSPRFTISSDIYVQRAPVFLEFFNAQLQQNSAYHADMHTGYTPIFNAWADGSPIMVADQAALTLIRLGSAYNENPQLFATDKYDIYSSGKPDMQEYIRSYVEFLKGLQGVRVTEHTDGTGFRLDRGIKIMNAFVPGPTARTSLDVYIPGNPPKYLETVPVHSLCSHLSGSSFNACVADAANYYKCQIDEPCLNISYIDRTGTVSYAANDFAVSEGWAYEFGCYIDIHINAEQYINDYNPCLIFQPDTSEEHTVYTLLAFMEALPAVHAYSPAEGQALFDRALNTYNFIIDNYALDAEEQGFVGAAEFLLYDATGDEQYLRAAHARRSSVRQFFIADRVEGNEFYWEEYIRHRSAITSAGLQYAVNGQNPEELFRGKMWGDWKDLGAERSISRTGERVFQFDNNIQFQNSRFMLTEAIFAAKTVDLHPSAEPFISVIADSQLSWLTGMNAVQMGTGGNPPVDSTSFIFGIGDSPSEQHSRYYVDSGYSSATGGRVVGARGTGYQFFDGSGYVYLDGSSNILGHTLGSLGNNYRGESYNEPFDLSKQFSNGLDYIPGWINGAFDVTADTDTIFNYRDTTNTYENTETTNEIVAAALELIAYLDAERNDRARLPMPQFTPGEPPVCTPSTEVCDSVDNDCDGLIDEGGVCNPPDDDACYDSVQHVPVTCSGSIVRDVWNGCRAVECSSGSGSIRTLACDKGSSFEIYKQGQAGTPPQVCYGSTCISGSGFASGSLPVCTGTTQPPTCTPSAEVCDSADNDCDGSVDEGNVCAPTCTPSTERCDSVDNDCDGSIDEGGVCDAAACYTSVQHIPASCTGGSISSDSWNGCREIICASGNSRMQVLACDKNSVFEMYKQSQSGSAVSEICIGSTCISDGGFARSGQFPICTGTAPPPPTCTPSTEVCDSADNDCDGSVDEGNVCAPPPSGEQATLEVADWYPKGRDYVFECSASNNPTRYEWYFGDGEKQLWGQSTVYYSYPASGNYLVECVAVGSTRASDTLSINVQ